MKIIHNNDIKTITLLDERYYQSPVTKNWYPSNTTVLDVYPKGFGFTQWLKDLGHNADEVLKRAGEQGTRIHDAIESFLLGGELKWIENDEAKFSLDEWVMILKFVEFYKTYKPETIAVETALVSDELGFGTRLDYVCRINNETWYLDFKSGAGIYKSNRIQAVACQRAWNEQSKDKITRVGLFHLKAQTRGADKSGQTIQGEGWKVDEVMPDEQDKMWRLFEHTLAIWKEENPNPKPKNMVYLDRVKIDIV